ncbi:hypothetical protein K1X76_00070 [bacterium]|nr:hypothetical protein [bacterium]
MTLRIIILTDVAIFLFMLFVAPTLGNLAYIVLKNEATMPLFGLFLFFIFAADWYAQANKLKIIRYHHTKKINDSNARILFFYPVWCCRMLFEFVSLNLAINAFFLHFFPKKSAWYGAPLAIAALICLVKVSHLVFVETQTETSCSTEVKKPLIIHFLYITCMLVIASTVFGSMMPTPALTIHEWLFLDWNYFYRKPMEVFWYVMLIGMMYLPLRWVDVIESDMMATNMLQRVKSLLRYLIEGALVLSPMLRNYIKG